MKIKVKIDKIDKMNTINKWMNKWKKNEKTKIKMNELRWNK